MLDPWYVTGFCDGEAAFTYSRAGGTFGIYFSVRQRADNRQIVEEIRGFFQGMGSLYHSKGAPPARNSGNTRASTYYRVTKIEELKGIVEHFDKYPLQSNRKREAYQTWRAMVMHKLERYRDIDYDTLRVFAEKLSRLNTQTRAPKLHTH